MKPAAILSPVRRLARRALRRSGFQRRIAPSFVDVMQHWEVDVVLDVGANDGGFGREIRDGGYRGRIVSFEPNPVAFARLQRATAADPLWEAVPFALGEEAGELALQIAEADVLSSFKPVTDWGASLPYSRVTATVMAKVVRLEDFLAERPHLLGRPYLKIDTQGFEMEVLRGAGACLDRLCAVQAELPLVKTYRDEEDWLAVISWLRARGFELATAVCNSRVGAQAREFDFVFVQRPRDTVNAQVA